MKLGPVYFRDFEVPAGISFGGRQNVVLHRLDAGRRVVDVQGPENLDISFSGTFSGNDAVDRVRAVDSLRMAGVEVPLLWGKFYYVVIVTRLLAHYENAVWIPYKIVCAVVRDAATLRSDDRPEGGNPLASSKIGSIETALDLLSRNIPELPSLAAVRELLANQAPADTKSIDIDRILQIINEMLLVSEAAIPQATLHPRSIIASSDPLKADVIVAARTINVLITVRSYLSIARSAAASTYDA